MSTSDIDTQELRTCYLAAPINTDLKAIEELLVERQIQPIVSADLASTAFPMPTCFLLFSVPSSVMITSTSNWVLPLQKNDAY